jgi:hypothetical protein
MKAIKNADENIAYMRVRFKNAVPNKSTLEGIINIVRLELITAYREGYADGKCGREESHVKHLG